MARRARPAPRARASACAGARASRRPTTARSTKPCSRRSSISSPSTTTGSSIAACASRARSCSPARRSRRSGRAGSWRRSASRRSGNTLRTVAQVNPRWALRVAPHLVRFDYDDPQWDAERGQVTAREVVTLFGLTLASERRVDYGRVEPKEARRLFIAEALAADQVGLQSRRAGVPRAQPRGAAARCSRPKRGCASAISSSAKPASRRSTTSGCRQSVHDRASLASLVRRRATARELRMTLGDVATRDPGDLAALGYSERARRSRASGCRSATSSSPATTRTASPSRCRARCSARSGPSSSNGSCRRGCATRCVAYLRALPKEQRRALVPLPDTAHGALAAIAERRGAAVVADRAGRGAARRCAGSTSRRRAFDERSLPAHLKLRVAVVDADGRVLAASRDLAALQRELGARARSGAAVEAAPRPRASSARSLRAGTSATCRTSVVVAQRPRDLTLYPCARRRRGPRRPDARAAGPGRRRAAPRRRAPAAAESAAAAGGVDPRAHARGPGARARVSRRRRQRRARRRLAAAPRRAGVRARSAGAHGGRVRSAPRARPGAARRGGRCTARAARARSCRCSALCGASSRRPRRKTRTPRVRDELAAQLAELVGPRMLTDTPREWRAHLPRYLRAAEQRWEKRGAREEPKLAAEVERRSRAARALARRAARRRAVAARRSSITAGCSRSFACRCSRSSSARCARCRRSGSSRRGARRSRARELTSYWPVERVARQRRRAIEHVARHTPLAVRLGADRCA